MVWGDTWQGITLSSVFAGVFLVGLGERSLDWLLLARVFVIKVKTASSHRGKRKLGDTLLYHRDYTSLYL